MANGWGGKRPNSGPKVGADGKALKPYSRRDQSKSSSDSSRKPADAQVISTKPATPNRPMFSPESVEAIISAFRELKSRRPRPRTPETNPYMIRPELFGPVAVDIKKRKPTLAMDADTGLVSANSFAVQAWQNGSLGGGDDASEGMLFLGYPYLSQLTQRPEFRLFGEIMSEEMTRKWIEFRGTDDASTKENDKPKRRNDDDDEADRRRQKTGEKPRSDDRNKEIERKVLELKDFAEELKLRSVFKAVAAQDSDFGIAHLYLDLKGTDIDNQRDKENAMSIGNGRDDISSSKLTTGCLAGLRTIEPIWCYPTAYNASNPIAPDWYDPAVWYVMGAEIHKTRLLPFIGRPVPDILKPAYAFGGLSMSQMAQPYVDIWLRTRESVGEIIHAFSVMVLSTELGTTTQPGGAGGGNGDILARMMLANMLRDNQGMMVIDKTSEDFKNISAPISGLDDLQAQAQEHMFSVGRIPAVKFAGIQPKGLNATSDGEMRAFNDTVHGRQEHLFRQHLTTVLDIMQISLWGKRDPDITYDFLPLHEETPKEKAEIRKIEAETDQVRVDSGVVSPEEVRAKVAADPESGFQGLDPDDVPDLLQEEQEGLIPEGAGKGLEAELEAGGKPRESRTAPKKDDGAEDDDLDDDDEFDGASDEWQEGKHPRDQDGKFASSGGGGGGGAAAEPSPEASKSDTLKKAKQMIEEQDLADPQQLASVIEAAEKHGLSGVIMKGLKSVQEKVGKPPAPAAGKPPASTTGGPNAAPQLPLKKLDVSKLDKVGQQMGSNPGGVYVDPANGEKFYVKKPKGPAQVKNEIAAAKLYQLAGAHTFEYLDAGPDHVATKIEALKKKNVSELSPEERKEAQRDFAIHAWLANWDAVGTGGDNVGVGADGKVKVLDTGGSLKYRAQGEMKDFGASPNELVTLRDPKLNPDAAALFGDMSEADMTASAARVADIPNNAIRDVVKAAGESEELANTLIARKNSIAQKFDLWPAGDTNPEWEALHPRGPGGKFAKKAGAEEPAKQEAAEPEESTEEIGGKVEIDMLLAKKPIAGSNYRKALQKALKSGGLSPEQTKTAAENLYLSWHKTMDNYAAKGDHDTAGKIKEKLNKIFDDYNLDVTALWEKFEAMSPSSPMMKPASVGKKKEKAKSEPPPAPAPAAPEPPPAPPPALEPPPAPAKPEPAKPEKSAAAKFYPEPTEADLAKAKKTAELKMEYVKGSKPKEPEGVAVANKLIADFNEKYAGKEITDHDELVEKVAQFKGLSDAINAMGVMEEKGAQEANAAALAKIKQVQKEKAEQEAKKAAEEAAKHAERNKKFMSELGISEKQAEGMYGLAQMLGMSGKDLVGEFKHYEEEAKGLGYPISGFQCAVIKNYSGSGYQAVNSALRSGAWTPAQHAYVSMVNKALSEMPKHTGVCKRGTDLTAAQIAQYKPGHIVQENAFLSTASTGSGFSGNVRFTVTAIGKRGASIQKLSLHPSENEVLFQARTFFKVNKVEKKDGFTEIHMEEWEEH